MTSSINSPPVSQEETLIRAVRHYFEARDLIRKGVCLLNAGQYEQARRLFLQAQTLNPDSDSLADCIAAAWIGSHRPAKAAQAMKSVISDRPDDIHARIRRALMLAEAGKTKQAVSALRDAIREHPECAELHFQLGTLLSSIDDFEEAELRFTQAIAIDANYTDALISLAMCKGVRQSPADAVHYLQRAQWASPDHPKLNLLLAMAVEAAREQGEQVHARAMMPGEQPKNSPAIEELSRIVESEPEFVEAFLDRNVGELAEEVYVLLVTVLKRALRRKPNHADLLYRCGCTLTRLGRNEEAILQLEQAVTLNPRLIGAVVQLARLYMQTERHLDAQSRLEQALELGFEYADVYYMLGTLYQHTQNTNKACWAYRKALEINADYSAARTALERLEAA